MPPTRQPPHTFSSYDAVLHRPRSTISQMGGLCEAQLTTAVDAVTVRDGEGAAAVVSLDTRIDGLHLEADSAAIGIIGSHAPLAEDLCEVVATLKIASWLECVGDYANNTATRAVLLAKMDTLESEAHILDLAAGLKRQSRLSLNAYIHGHVVLAGKVVDGDRAIDACYAGVFEGLLAFAGDHPGALAQVTQLHLVSKNLERTGDQTANIAKQVRYAVSRALSVDGFAIPANTGTDLNDY